MINITSKNGLKNWMINLVYDQCSRCEYSDACCGDCIRVKNRLAEVTEIIKCVKVEGEEE